MRPSDLCCSGTLGMDASFEQLKGKIMTSAQFADRIFAVAEKRGIVTSRGVIQCSNGKTINREEVRALYDLCVKKKIHPLEANTKDRKSLKIQSCCSLLLQDLIQAADVPS